MIMYIGVFEFEINSSVQIWFQSGDLQSYLQPFPKISLFSTIWFLKLFNMMNNQIVPK
jgi:hypothetical protein